MATYLAKKMVGNKIDSITDKSVPKNDADQEEQTAEDEARRQEDERRRERYRLKEESREKMRQDIRDKYGIKKREPTPEVVKRRKRIKPINLETLMQKTGAIKARTAGAPDPEDDDTPEDALDRPPGTTPSTESGHPSPPSSSSSSKVTMTTTTTTKTTVTKNTVSTGEEEQNVGEEEEEGEASSNSEPQSPLDEFVSKLSESCTIL